MDDLGHQAQHATRTLKFFQRTPARIKLVEQLRVNRIGLFQLAPIVLISAALRKVLRVFAVQLHKLLQRVVPVVELVTRDLLEQPAANDLVAFFLARRPPR